MAKRPNEKKVQLSRRAALWYVTTGIMLSLWMFILGVWVGQGGLSWLIQAEEKPTSLALLLSRGRPPVAPPPATPPATRTIQSPPAPKPAAKPPVKPIPGPKPGPSTPSPQPPPPPKARPVPPPDHKDKKPHVVIVASVAGPDQARKLVARWKKLGVRLLSVKSEVSGRPRYRLRTIKTYTFAEAKKARDRLKKLGRKIGAVKLWIMRVDR
ncbi:MAG: SPOR domain-containing protein [Proteobacteria bacterium]|nr:SPOR domain-containing protein [Pseudomonadota bacterium]MBU1740460.1 SPOR domain-containing protein [Pseudomonadota bacterium]